MTAEELNRRTPPHRDRYIDLLRAGSLLVVIAGHAFMALVTPQGQLSNTLVSMPRLQPVTWVLQIMPVFFLVGGVVTATSLDRRPALGSPGRYAAFYRGRAVRLLRPAWVFIAVWVTVGLLMHAGHLTGPSDRPGLADAVLRLSTQLLWFLGVYLGVGALAPVMLRLHHRFGWWVVAALAGLVGVVDVTRFTTGVTAVASLNFVFAWTCIHQLGFCWRDGRLDRRTARFMVAAGLLGLVVCVTAGPYPVSMVGLPGEPISNLGPPTFALLCQSIMLCGLAVLGRRIVEPVLQRPRVWAVVVGFGSVAMSVYLWHLTALIVMFGVALAAGWHLPAAGTVSWWLTRPLWYAALALLTVPLVAVFRRFDVGGGPANVPARRARDLAATLAAIVTPVAMLMISVTGTDVLSHRTSNFLGLPVTPAVAVALVTTCAVAIVSLGWRRRDHLTDPTPSHERLDTFMAS